MTAQNPNASAITVYTKPGCPGCTATKRMLDRSGTDYTTVDVTTDPDAYRYVTEDLGLRQMPVVVADGDTPWTGFRDDRITALIKRTAA